MQVSELSPSMSRVGDFVWCGYLEVVLASLLHVLYGAAVSFLHPLLSTLVLHLHLLELLAQVLPLLTELSLQLLQGMLGLGQLHLQALFQQGNLHTGQQRKQTLRFKKYNNYGGDLGVGESY